MLFQFRTFWFPKDVDHAERYQDACQVDQGRSIAAIADGVSSTLFSRPWADLLTRAVVEYRPDVDDGQGVSDWLGELRTAWTDTFDPTTLAWHQKAKIAEGAASTLLWTEFYHADPNDGQAGGPVWMRCFSIGDCCLFHVRGGQVLRAFPFESSGQFATNPAVLRSVERRQDPTPEFDTLQDYCQWGDLLVLCSDALAVWALTRLESGQSPDWESFWAINDEQWAQRIAVMRAGGQIRFDDTTIVLLRIEQQPLVQTSSEDRQSTKTRGSFVDDLANSLQDLQDLASKWLTKSQNTPKKRR